MTTKKNPTKTREKRPVRTLRVSDELWDEVRAKAAREGVTVSSIMTRSLNEFLAE